MAPQAWPLIIQSGCVYTRHKGRVTTEWLGAGGRLGPGTQTFAPGAPVNLNEEVPHSGGYQVTNQMMLIGRDQTQDKRIHLACLTPIVPATPAASLGLG